MSAEPQNSIRFDTPAARQPAERAAPSAASAERPVLLDADASWLLAHRQLLEEASDGSVPLLERTNLLAEFSASLDRFFGTRVARLRRPAASLPVETPEKGLRSLSLHPQIRQAVLDVLEARRICFENRIRPELAGERIRLLEFEELGAADLAAQRAWFEEHVFSLLTPLIVDPTQALPWVATVSTLLAVSMELAEGAGMQLARITIPSVLPQWIPLPSEPGEFRFVRLVDVVKHSLDALFPGARILSAVPFRVTLEEEAWSPCQAGNDSRETASALAGEPGQRAAVRMEYAAGADPAMVETLLKHVRLRADDAYPVAGELDYGALHAIAQLDLPALKYPVEAPVTPGPLAVRREDIFSVLRRGDVLVHHPYESFAASVEQFVRMAAIDPQVVSLKIAMSRIGDDPLFIQLLIHAAESGKQVVCLIQHQPQGDELRGRNWVNALEKAGVYVSNRSGGLAAHARMALVVRQEAGKIRCYAHIGTGNYHPVSGRSRTDFGLFSAKPELTRDLVSLFHALTGETPFHGYRKLLVGPTGLREHFLRRIQREAEFKRMGRAARIVVQMNSLEDPELCDALCRASVAGVRIDLIVRSACCLRPGIPGWTEMVRVLAIRGRFREHARICYFRNGAEDAIDGEFLLGSADWTPEALDRRIELFAPVEDRSLRALCVESLQVMLEERAGTWRMQPDGTFLPCRSIRAGAAEGVQRELIRIARQRATCFAVQALSDRDPGDIDFEVVQPAPVRAPWMIKANRAQWNEQRWSSLPPAES